MNPLAYIIVLNWNGKRHLKECFRSLENLAYDNYRLLLVDNGSTDGSVEYIKSRYPTVEIIRNEKNLGFSGGNNLGIRRALEEGADYVVMLNNDTRVEPDFLFYLVQYGETHPDTGVLGGTVKMEGDRCRINSTGVNINLMAYGWDRDFGIFCDAVERKDGEVLAVTGALMAVKREVFERIGLLDTRFFAYFEDVDFCIRVWKYTEFTVNYVPQSVIYHKFSASAGTLSPYKKRLMMKNQYRIFFKHFPLRIIFILFPLLVLFHLIQNRSDPSAFLDEIFTAGRQTILLPAVVFNRIQVFSREKEARSERYWEKVIKEIGLPKINIEE